MNLTQRRWWYLKHNLNTGTQPCLKLGIPLDLLVTVKSLPAVLETPVWSLGQEDPVEKETATHSSILAWRISWMEEPGRLQSMGSQRVRHDWVTNTHTHTHTPRECRRDKGCLNVGCYDFLCDQICFVEQNRRLWPITYFLLGFENHKEGWVKLKCALLCWLEFSYTGWDINQFQ